MNALELHGLEKHYPDFALGPIDLELPGGTVCGLIGENGAGKSTTIKLILDMIDREAGTVKLFGQEEITPLAKADIGVVMGGEGIPTCLTAPQVGKVMAGIYPNWDAAAYADWCRRFDLPENKKYGDYSTGMKMKQCLAVAFSHHPKLLLLDEATSGLDPVVRDEYALWHGTAGQLEELDRNAVVSHRVTAYGAEALVKRELVPLGSTLTPVSIEELFVLMVKGENMR